MALSFAAERRATLEFQGSDRLTNRTPAPASTGHRTDILRNSDDCDQSFQRIATSVTRVRDGAVG
jgi:hypothetical protein